MHMPMITTRIICSVCQLSTCFQSSCSMTLAEDAMYMHKTRRQRNGVIPDTLFRRQTMRTSDVSLSHSYSSSIDTIEYSEEEEEFESDDVDYSIEDDEDEHDISNLFGEMRISPFASYLNKFLLVVPVGINIVFRSIASHDFRAIAIAWAVILPFTSDISLDEGVFPALVATSLGYDNSVVARNMYISIARSRLGLLALALLSYYSKNYHILICGILLKLLVSFAMMILQNSIPKSETTLICGAVVNVVYHLLGSRSGSIYDPEAIIASGLVAAVPCYPLLAKFVKNYRVSRGTKRQTPLVLAVYAFYFSVAVYLYFGFYGVSAIGLFHAVVENRDLLQYWFGILGAGMAIAYLAGPRIGLDGRRKLWHLCTVVMFLPEYVRQRDFTKTSLAVAIVLLVALETARATALPPFGIPLHNALQSFIDYRDKRGPVIISHLYLLLGIAVPIFLDNSPAGVICLGLGDTVASQFGRRFGRWRVFGHKSIEGCIGFAVVTGLALKYLTRCTSVWQIVIPTAILEAVTPLNDNLVVPMYMLALQGLFTKSS